MPKNVRSVVVDADPDTVWALVRDFNGLSTWFPALPASVIEDDRPADQVGCVRRFGDDEDSAREKLTALDDVARSYTYTLVSGPFRVTGYLATVRVTPIHDGTTPRSVVEWSNTYECDPADADGLATTFADHIFGPALASLRDHFAG